MARRSLGAHGRARPRYASPAFWKSALGDTTAFATAGNKLWIAHWDDERATNTPRAEVGWSLVAVLAVERLPSRPGDHDGLRRRRPLQRIRSFTRRDSCPTRRAARRSLPPTIVGAAQSGRVLAGIPGAWTGGKPVSFLYQWLRCDAAGANCIPISGATTEKYTPCYRRPRPRARCHSDDAECRRRCVRLLPANRCDRRVGYRVAVAPGVDGLTDDLRGDGGGPGADGIGRHVDGSPTTFAYQWRRCDGTGNACGAIAGATASAYTISPGDIGSAVSLVVTATGSGGSQSAPTTATGGRRRGPGAGARAGLAGRSPACGRGRHRRRTRHRHLAAGRYPRPGTVLAPRRRLSARNSGNRASSSASRTRRCRGRSTFLTRPRRQARSSASRTTVTSGRRLQSSRRRRSRWTRPPARTSTARCCT